LEGNGTDRISHAVEINSTGRNPVEMRNKENDTNGRTLYSKNTTDDQIDEIISRVTVEGQNSRSDLKEIVNHRRQCKHIYRIKALIGGPVDDRLLMTCNDMELHGYYNFTVSVVSKCVAK
jgi:hypothetical protein